MKDLIRTALTENPNIYFQYMRGQHRKPIGCAVAIKYHGKVLVGWSKFNTDKEKKPFDKDLAVFKAFQRAMYGNTTHSYPDCMRKFVAFVVSKSQTKFGEHRVVVK